MYTAIADFGTFQHHRFGRSSSRGDLYLDVTPNGLHWVVRSKSRPEEIVVPRVDTWRSAYNTLRRMEAGALVGLR